MKKHHRQFVKDVVTYLEHHRPWRVSGLALEDDADQALYEQARALMSEAPCPDRCVPVPEDWPE